MKVNNSTSNAELATAYLTTPPPLEEIAANLDKRKHDLGPAERPPRPALDPVQGWGGADVINWATEYLDDTEFRDTYEHRAAHLLTLHGDLLTEEAKAKLNSL